jgi:hypothetical protein
MPKSDSDDPRRAQLRKESDAPRWAMSRTAMDEPRREKLLIDKEAPK